MVFFTVIQAYEQYYNSKIVEKKIITVFNLRTPGHRATVINGKINVRFIPTAVIRAEIRMCKYFILFSYYDFHLKPEGNLPLSSGNKTAVSCILDVGNWEKSTIKI